MEKEVCCVHKEVTQKIKNEMPQPEMLYDLAELFKMFGDSTRISILCSLLEDELCVGDIAELLGMGQSAVSHQLRLLKAAGLVRARRDGRTIYYSLDDSHVHDIFSLGLEHLIEKE